MMKVLITGASGFIGRILVDEAIKRGYKTFAGVRKSSNRNAIKNPFVEFLEMDLSSKKMITNQLKSLKEDSKNFDYIIHAAGITKTCKKSDFDLVNYQYTRNLTTALVESNSIPKKFVFISSLAACGPGNEDKLSPIRNDHIPQPKSEYGKSKLKAEKHIRSLDGFPYIILRPTGVYGPGDKDYYQVYKSLNMGLEFYIGSKEQHLSFIHVSDLCRLVFDTLESDQFRKSYFVSDLEDYTSEEFNFLIKKELNKKSISIVFPKPMIRFLAYVAEKFACMFGTVSTLNTEKYHEISSKNWLCDSLDLIEDFDFVPEYKLENGIRQTLDWYKKEKLL